MKAFVGVVLFALAAASACSPREHIRDDYGAAYKSFFARQVIHTKAAEGTPLGLDSEEASIIHGSYRQELGGKKEDTPDPESRVLVVEEGGKNAPRSK